jgi:hypothetical protein
LAEQNLLLYSNTLTNAYWNSTAGLGTPVLNATDPTGTASGAYTLTASVGSAAHVLQTAAYVASGTNTYTVSAYLQAGTNNFASLIAFGITSTNWATVTFNLTSGSVGIGKTQSGALGGLTYVASSALFTQVGSTNWWRCSFQVTSTVSSVGVAVQINSAAAPTYGSYGFETWTALGTETILAYGLQLEQAKNLTTYTPSVYTATTATAVNTYTPTLQSAAINAPRFDYNPTTRESLGLLLEQASTNLALYSSDYTNAAWTKNNCTITAAADISPDGTQNASLMVLGTTSVAHILYNSSTYTAATWTVSVYVKYYGQQFFQLYSSVNGNVICNFDLINGLKGTPSGGGSPTADIQNVGNGWYRCSLTLTALAGVNNFSIQASNSLTATSAPAFAGNSFNGYLIWGAQVEAASSATSYIANTSAATTRTVDSASMTGTNFTSWYNYSGGTVYIEAASGNPTTAANPAIFSVNDASTVNQIANYFSSTGSLSQVTINGNYVTSTTNAFPTSSVANTFYKISWYFSTAGLGISSVGQTAITAATSINVPAVNKLTLGATGIGLYPLNGRIKKFAYYPLPLTNTQIQSLSAN